jgi:glycosyltransferase involved in cell wall biosynthesis
VKVLLLPADKSGCGYYRMTEPVRAIQELGFDVELEVDYGLDVDGERVNGVTTLRDVDPHGADVVVFQRPSNMMMLSAMRLLQSRGIACVVEIDDLFHSVSNAHAGYRGIVQDGAAERILACAREADLVTVATPALAVEYGRHGRVAVVPNAMPERVLDLPPAYERNPDPVTVGWTHPHDLQIVGTGLRTALDRSSGQARFAILGQAHGAQERLNLASSVEEIRWLPDVDEYLQEIGQRFEIGVAPLRDDRFNRSKSWLKPLEYGSRGVFIVRSRVDEYERLGLGMPARSPKDWARWLSKAVTDYDYRATAAEGVRERIRAFHLTQHTAERWVAAWRQALENRTRS